MAAIDTKLDLSRVSGVGDIKSFKEAPSVSVSRSQTQKGSKFESLAKALRDVSPVLLDWSNKYSKEKSAEETLEGANAINGMTLNDARVAHKAGFPDIENPWARYGAYKQYAINAADNFQMEFQKSYIANQGDKNYSWEADFNERTSSFLTGKEDDVYFQSAFNAINSTTRSWINKKEVERQSAFLTERVTNDTSFQVKTIPDRVKTRLEVDFLENWSLPHDFDDASYFQAQNEFFKKNFEKYWDEELDLIKTNLNPALTLSDLDSIILDQGEAHLAVDGRFASFYAKMITEERPDGTPSIIDNPKYVARAKNLLTEIKLIDNLNKFETNFKLGNVSSYNTKEFNKNANSMLKQKIKFYKASEGLDDNQAFAKAVLELIPAMKVNAPIRYVQEILSRPIGREITRDNRLALELAVLLQKEGLFGTYFDENNKNSVLWSIAVNKYNAAEMPNADSILKELGDYQGNFTKQDYATLISEDKKEFVSKFSDLAMNKPKNRAVIYSMAEYFKNIVPDTWSEELESWVEKNYEVFNETLYSKNKLQLLGITADKFDYSKAVVAELLIEKLDLAGNIEDDNLTDIFMEDMAVTGYREVGKELKKIPSDKLTLIMDNYELIINAEDGELSLGIEGDVNYKLPATFTKDGNTYWLTIPVEEFKARLMKKDEEYRLIKIQEAEEKNLRHLEDLNKPMVWGEGGA